MRWMVAVVASLLVLTSGTGSLIEDAAEPACSVLDFPPVNTDTTDLCKYQYDFDTWGDARDECIDTETGKHIVADGPEKDALFVLFDDQDDNLYVDFPGGGEIQVTYTPNAPVQGVWVEMDVTDGCGTAIAFGAGPSTAAVIGEQLSPGALASGKYQLGVSVRTQQELIDDLYEELQDPAANVLILSYLAQAILILAQVVADPSDTLAEVLSTTVGPPVTIIGFVEDQEATDIINLSLLLTEIGSIGTSAPSEGIIIHLETQCAPVCVANGVDTQVNPRLGYRLGAQKISLTP